MSRRSSPTIDEVAARAGVSRGTVSRVVNGEPGVAPWRVEAVRAAVAELDYQPNLAARSLVTQRTDSVGLVVAGAVDGVLGHEYFSRTVRGVHRAVREGGRGLVLLSWADDEERQRVERFLGSGHLAGAMLLGLPLGDRLAHRLQALGIEAVVAGRVDAEIDGDPGLTQLDADNLGGARQAVEHLVVLGRRRIATIAGPAAMSAGADRFTGWRDVLAEHGLEHGDDLVETGDFTRGFGESAMRRLLERRPDLDAVFAAGDDMALGALDALRAAGRGVPDEVAVVGFDGSDEGARAVPALSSVEQPVEELGVALGRALVDRLAGRAVPGRLLATRLVVRASSGGAPSLG